MLELPAPRDDVIRILGIDPGTDTLGVGIIDVNIETFEPTVVFGHTFKASKMIDKTSTIAECLGNRALRLAMHAESLSECFICTAPTLIAAETPFLKFGRVSAYEALVECYAMMQKAVWDYSPSFYLHRVDPVSAKNYVGVSHKGTDKNDVRRGVLEHFKGKVADGVPIETFDEHTIDAIAVANCLYRRELLSDNVESTRKKRKFRKRKRKAKKR